MPRSFSLIDPVAAAEARSLAFVQISDSHIGFNKDANPDRTQRCRGDRESARPAEPWRAIHAAHRRCVAPVEARGARYRSANHRHRRPRRSLRARRARRARRQWQRLLRALQRRGRSQVVQLRSSAHTSSRSRTCSTYARAASGAWARSNSTGSKRIARSFREHAFDRLHAHAAVGPVSGMGLGNRRFGSSADLRQALRLGNRAERARPPSAAEGRGARELPHRDVDRISAAGSGTAPSPVR